MTCNIHFDPYELPTIQLNDKIFIKDAYYRINKISGYNLSKRASVQVELLKAPVSRFKFKRHRGVRIGDITADLTLSDFNPISGQATYVDVETGQTYSSGSFLKNIAKLDALAFQGDKAVYTPEFNLTLQTDNRNNLDGNLNQDASIGYALGSITEGSVGKDVDRAIAVGSNIDLQQNAKSVMTIGDGLTVADGSTYSTILNTKDATIESANNYGFIIGGSGSSISGGDYVGIINSEIATARDSDYTTIINGHTNDVVLNGNGHVVINMDKAGAGIDFSDYRENSNYLGDTYMGQAMFREYKQLELGSGTSVLLYDTPYIDDNLYFLNWSGFSPGTATLTLPNAVNTDHKRRVLTFATKGTFDGTTQAVIEPFTSGQTINGKSSLLLKNPYDSVTMIASGSGWVTLDKTAPRFYGAFYASSSQALDTTLAGQSVEFNGGWEDYGFRITSGSRITIENPGTYKLEATFQVTNDSNQQEDFITWLKFNGTDWPFSGKTTTLPPEKSAGNPSAQTVSVAFVGTSQAVDDYVELFWVATDTDVALTAYTESTGSPSYPALPAVSVMVTPI